MGKSVGAPVLDFVFLKPEAPGFVAGVEERWGLGMVPGYEAGMDREGPDYFAEFVGKLGEVVEGIQDGRVEILVIIASHESLSR